MRNIYRRFLIGLLVLIPTFGRAQDTGNVVIAPHLQDLVVVQGNKLVPLNSDRFLKAPYTVLYFGAGWCPDCRRFSPSLVMAYNHQKESEPRFEVLLLTMDKTENDMLQYMRSERMKWPALAFDKMSQPNDLKKYYSHRGIPCLSVIDQKGTVVLQSKSDQDAAEVLKQLKDLLKNKPR